jgi:hypothetical protein
MAPRSLVPRLLGALSTCVALLAQAPVEQTIRYGRDIRPLLSDRCFRCHGPDANERAADLRLDERRFAIADLGDGAAAIVPGDPDRSLLMERIRSHDDQERMPPPSSNKPALQPAEIERFAQWIREGAAYEGHWAFEPPKPQPVPNNGAGHPIDAFVRQQLQRVGAEPSPAAAPATLCRRLFLVLTGLPPTPRELQAYLDDARSDRYERLVDRLLTEEPYATRHAEHLASIWLDAGRYADTSGIHMDAGRQAWLWRDWLIQAIRDDKPFDAFVVEQLAGDLLPDATDEQKVATGFLRNHVTTDEGGAINAEYLVEYAAERTATVGSVLMGLTLGCARCHDHKYDPISQQDYYQLFSFFNNNEEPGLYSQARNNPNRALEPNLSVPTDAQHQRRGELSAQIEAARALRDQIDPDERRNYGEFLARVGGELSLHWTRPRVEAAHSSGGATLTVLDDGSVLGSGDNPDHDVQRYELRTHATAQRWLCLEALPDASLPQARTSRASHGNTVLQHLRLEARPLQGSGDGEAAWREVPLIYALADIEQQNGDFGVGNALVDDGIGWAPAGHQQTGPRTAWFLAGEPFGFEGGTELRVTLKYDSRYRQHVFGRVRFATSRASDAGMHALPLWTSGYYTCGPFASKNAQKLYETAFGPELATSFERDARFQHTKSKGAKAATKGWSYREKFGRDRTNLLNNGVNAVYVGQRIWVPSRREVEFQLGSDDGFQLYVDGQLVGQRRVARGVRLDQDRAKATLTAGAHFVVLKIVNTGGAGGFALQTVAGERELRDDLFLAMVPDVLGDPERQQKLLHAYRSKRSPVYLERTARLAELQQQAEALEASVPMAMVMQERGAQRPTFVLMRGEYDKADPQRPVTRELPKVFGPLPAHLPKNRLGLARWLVSDDNPLLRRVAINRYWEFVFGTGIVRTSEDFGMQGEWPSHPELLDWLALEFADRGHSVRQMLRLMVTSETFRQRSRVGDVGRDPDNRLLGWFPRRRLTAEAIRDQALYVGGLLVERTGGPSVKPYQPQGLWREVAMLQSNTRIFERDDGDALWRRSLYTYWKRACPPPSLLTFDAPTREFCTIRRSTTNTPLQALVLWNDEQFVEAARELASRSMRAAPDDEARLVDMYRRTTGRTLRGEQLQMARETLRQLQRRYQQDPDGAGKLLAVGEKPVDGELDAARLAAFTVLASAFLDLDATLYID